MMVFIVALGVNLIPDLISSAPGGGTWLLHWLQYCVLPTQHLDTALGTWGTELIYNQSLGGTLERLVNTTLQWTAGELSVEQVTRVNAVTLKAIAYGAMLLLLVVSMAPAVRGNPVTADGAQPNAQPAVMELGVLLSFSC